MKHTPLHEAHVRLGGKLIEFGGWEMPVYYTSIVDEHQAVRKAAGIFDISHMGEVQVEGPAAEGFLNQLLTNDVRKLTPGQGQYTLMCNPSGGVVDDLYVYRLGNAEFLLIVNASRTDADYEWIRSRLAEFDRQGQVQVRNASAEMGAVAVQGPRVAGFIDRCFAGPARQGTPVASPSGLKKNELASFLFRGEPVWVARTGYTGEDGFEVVADARNIQRIWDNLLETGGPQGLKPAGLGARDTLRTEMCYPLYGHELDEQTSPIQAGLGYFVALDKGDFVGRAALAEQKANGPSKKLVAFKMTGRSAPPRPGYAICEAAPGSGRLGTVVSGTQSPSLGVGIGLGYVPAAHSKPGTALDIEIRGNRFGAVVAPKPLYRKAG